MYKLSISNTKGTFVITICDHISFKEITKTIRQKYVNFYHTDISKKISVLKTPFLIFFAFILISNQAYSQTNDSDQNGPAENEKDFSTYVVFVQGSTAIGSGELGDPAITFQKRGDKITNPTIFTDKVMKDNKLPVVVIASATDAGEPPPQVARFIINYRLENGEEPTVILLNKETKAKINESLKEDLDKLDLELKDNVIVPKPKVKDLFKSKLHSSPTMGSLAIKELIQVLSCVFLVKFSKEIKDPAAWQMITFLSVNMLVTAGINLFIEEFIKLRSTAASVVKKGIDKQFDAMVEVFEDFHNYIGDITRPQGQKNLLRASIATVAHNRIISSKVMDWLRKGTQFVIRGDMALQYCISLPMTLFGWSIWGVSEQTFKFMDRNFGIIDHGLETVIIAGVVLTVINSLTAVPLDLSISRLNSQGVLTNKKSITASLIMEVDYSKDKLTQIGLVSLNMVINAINTVLSLPAYLYTHVTPDISPKNVVHDPTKNEVLEIVKDIRDVFRDHPDIKIKVETLDRLKNREANTLGIGFIDELFTKADVRLLLDLTYILQEYVDDGTIDKIELENKSKLRDLMAKLKILRKPKTFKEVITDLKEISSLYPDPDTKAKFSIAQKKVIYKAKSIAQKARNVDQISNNFWAECGVSFKRKMMPLLEVMGWANSELFSDNKVYALIQKAITEPYLSTARSDLTLAKQMAKGFANKNELLKKIDLASIRINDELKDTLVKRISEFLKNENVQAPDTSPDGLIEFAVKYMVEVKHGAMDSAEITEIVIGDPEGNFENSLLKLAKEDIYKTLLRSVIFCNQYVAVDRSDELKVVRLEENIKLVDFFTNVHLLPVTDLLIGDGVNSPKLGPDNFSTKFLPSIKPEALKLGSMNFKAVQQEMGLDIIRNK